MTDTPTTKFKDMEIFGAVSKDTADKKISISWSDKGVRTHRDGWGKPMDTTIGQLLAMLAEHHEGTKDGRCVLQGALVGNERKTNSMRSMDLMILDLDTGEDMATMRRTIQNKGLMALLYTTHSHMKAVSEIKKDTLYRFTKKTSDQTVTLEDCVRYLIEVKRYQPSILADAVLGGQIHAGDGIVFVVNHAPMPKFRLVFFLKETVVIAERSGLQKEVVEEWKEKYAGLSHMLGAFYDRSCVDPARLMFTPRHPKGAVEYKIELIAGNLLDYETLPRVALKGDRETDNNNPFAQAAGDLGARSGATKTETEGLMPFIAKYADYFQAEDFMLYTDPDGDRGARSAGAGRTFRCPNDDYHTNAGDEEDKGFFCVNAGESDGGGFVMKCMHDSCAEIDRVGMLDIMCQQHKLTPKELLEFVPESERKEVIEDEKVIREPFFTAKDAREAISAIAPRRKDTLAKVEEVAERLGATNFSKETRLKLIEELYATSKVPKKTIMAFVGSTESDEEAEKRQETDDDTLEALKKFNERHAVVRIGQAARIIEETADKQEFCLTTLEAAKVLYANQFVIEYNADGKPVKKPLLMRWLEWEKRRDYSGLTFDPTGAPTTEYNIWRGLTVVPKKGDWSYLRNHIFEVICNSNEDYFNWFMTWVAQIYQQPDKKMGSALVIRGAKGTGKSIALDFIARPLGKHSIHLDKPEQITGRFNAHQENKLLLVCEEALFAGSHASNNTLKHLITSGNLTVERKGVDADEVASFARIAITSNEDWVVPVTFEDERRFFVLETTDKYRGQLEYFEMIREQMEDNGGLEAMVHEFTTMAPMTKNGSWSDLRTPPQTPWLVRQAMKSADKSTTFFIDLLERGTLRSDNLPTYAGIINLDDYEPNRIHFDSLEWFHNIAVGGHAYHQRLRTTAAILENAKKWLLVQGIEEENIGGVRKRYLLCPSRAAMRKAAEDIGVEFLQVSTVGDKHR